jgi:hypothetical protein
MNIVTSFDILHGAHFYTTTIIDRKNTMITLSAVEPYILWETLLYTLDIPRKKPIRVVELDGSISYSGYLDNWYDDFIRLQDKRLPT